MSNETPTRITSRPRALDLCCKAGGASRGLQLAGFHVTGVDIQRQPRYVGDAFVQSDMFALPFKLTDFDFIWASPHCQCHTALRSVFDASKYPDQIADVRAALLLDQAMTGKTSRPERRKGPRDRRDQWLHWSPTNNRNFALTRSANVRDRRKA